LPITHLLDPMHIEGNVGRSLIRHLYGEKNHNWRESCEEMGMHGPLGFWPSMDPLVSPLISIFLGF
jgi:hypothetical protein